MTKLKKPEDKLFEAIGKLDAVNAAIVQAGAKPLLRELKLLRKRVAELNKRELLS